MLGGLIDNWALPTDPASPDAQQIAYATAHGIALRSFDDTRKDGFFLHAFTWQGCCRVVSASLEIHMKPLRTTGLTTNDGFGFGPVGSGWWSRQIGSPNGLLPNRWNSTNYPNGAVITLDLANLPGGANILARMSALCELPVGVQDDTSVDYMILNVQFDCCPQSTPTPTATATAVPCTPTTTAIQQGNADNYAQPTETARPSANQVAYMTQHFPNNPLRSFDQFAVNGLFVTTFGNLSRPNMCIVTATLELHLKPVGDLSTNDTFGFAHYGVNPVPPVQSWWGHYIGNNNQYGTYHEGLTHDSWDITTHPTDRMILLDLANSPVGNGPSTANILGLMNLHGELSFTAQDDTVYDYLILRLGYACTNCTLYQVGSLSGRVYDGQGTALVNAPVQACPTTGQCIMTTTDSSGQYGFTNLLAGDYTISTWPAGLEPLGAGRIGPLTLAANGLLTDQDIELSGLGLPPGTTLQPMNNPYTAFWGNDLLLQTVQTTGGTASYEIEHNGATVREGVMIEGPPGTYTAHVPRFDTLPNSVHGWITICITIYYSNGTTITICTTIYIDPSGFVRTTTGEPLPGATVTLYRSDDENGPFDDAVPNGDWIMSPANRSNPDATNASGHFGWDTISGYYVVRATRPGCYAPGNPSQLYVESGVLTIPPAVTDLDLRMECPFIRFTDVPVGNPFLRYVGWMGTLNYVSGYGCGGAGEPCDPTNTPYFRPYSSATRGQFAKILSNSLLWTEIIPATQQTFADVPPSHPLWVFIERVAAHGAISGYGCGGPGEPCDAQNRPYFRPGNSITRGQIAKIVAGAMQLFPAIADNQQTFADVPPTHPFWNFIERVASQGLISGYACGGAGEPCNAQNSPYFRPGNTATRGQLSKIIYLGLDR